MRREDLPMVTPANFRKFKPCWLITAEGRARYKRIAAMKDEWNAIDVLGLEDVSARDKLWAVLREAFLPPMLLHEFACRCASLALSLVEYPDARSGEAICVKRCWMAGEVTDETLNDASRRGRDAWREALSVWRKAREAGMAACGAAQEYLGASSLYFIEMSAAGVIVNAASSAEWCVEKDAGDAARGAAFAAGNLVNEMSLVELLRELIDEWEE